MATYVITAPDGQEYEVDAPDDATEAQILAYAQANMPASEPAYQAPSTVAQDFSAGANRSLANLAGLPVDALAKALNYNAPGYRPTVSSPIDSPVGGSDWLKGILGKLGIQTEGPRNLAGMAGEYVATAPFTGGMGAAKAGSSVAAGVLKEMLSSGLAAGGGYVGTQVAPGNPIAEMAGAVAPGAVRAVASAATKPLMRTGVSPQDIQGNVNLANRIGAPVTATATVPSKPIQALAGASSAIPGGVSVAKRAGEEAGAALRGRVASIVGGESTDVTRAGNVISKGLFGEGGFISRFKARANSLYNAVDAKVAPTTAVPASNTYQYLSGANKGVPGAPEMSARMFVDDALQSDADAFFSDVYNNGGSIPYAALKRFRTSVGDRLADPDLIGSEQRATLKQLYGALSKDMEEVAVANGAAKEFGRANSYYSAGTQRIEDFFDSLNKKIAGEDIYKAVVSDSPQSKTRILTLKKSLTPEEWSYVRKTFVTRMGMPQPSAAVEGGTGFSASTFLTNYERTKKTGVADAVFGTGQFRRDIDDVAKYASNLKGSADILANPSGTAARGLTASVLFYALGLVPSTTVGVTLGGGAGAMTGAAMAAAGIGGATLANRALAGKLMASPEFVNWLATSTRIPATRMPGHIARLTTIALNNPDLESSLNQYLSAIGQ